PLDAAAPTALAWKDAHAQPRLRTLREKHAYRVRRVARWHRLRSHGPRRTHRRRARLRRSASHLPPFRPRRLARHRSSRRTQNARRRRRHRPRPQTLELRSAPARSGILRRRRRRSTDAPRPRATRRADRARSRAWRHRSRREPPHAARQARSARLRPIRQRNATRQRRRDAPLFVRSGARALRLGPAPLLPPLQRRRPRPLRRLARTQSARRPVAPHHARAAPNRHSDNLKRGAQIMARIDATSEIDWTQCELIEQVPGKVSGRPIVRGTRILPDAIVNGYDAGESLDLIHENYPGLSIPQIQRIIEFAHARRGQPVP